MNKHLRRGLLGSAWAGVGLTIAGASLSSYALAGTGFALLVGFIALALWSKSHKSAWYEALR